MGMMSELGQETAYENVLQLIERRLNRLRVAARRWPKQYARVISQLEELKREIEALKAAV